MMISSPFIKVEQPIGDLYVCVLTVNEILSISKIITRRESNKNGFQRSLDKNRVKSIADFSTQFNAVFPTSIILAGPGFNVTINDNMIKINNEISEIDKFVVVDGQHRLFGLKEAGQSEMELTVTFLFDITLEQSIHVFSSINSNQKPVPKSLIYDLYGNLETRSLEKVSHIIAKEMNSDYKSPFYKKLKMLGTKESADMITGKLEFQSINEDEIDFTSNYFLKNDSKPLPSLSQGIFVDLLINFISNNRDRDNNALLNNMELPYSNEEKLIFRQFFRDEEDHYIYLILRNYFNAAKEVFSNEWDNKQSIISKTTGFTALMNLLANNIFPKAKAADDYSKKFFVEKLQTLPAINNYIIDKYRDGERTQLFFTNDNFGSSRSAAIKLYNWLIH